MIAYENYNPQDFDTKKSDSMRPNESNRKGLELLNIAWKTDINPVTLEERLIIHKDKEYAIFTGKEYQSELSAFILGWNTALRIHQ